MQVRTGANTAGAYERLNLRPSPTRQAPTTGLRYCTSAAPWLWEMEIGDDKRSDDRHARDVRGDCRHAGGRLLATALSILGVTT
ncbi:hypothetical protein V496_03848 [Pseudogymnoascus sp. VKM F-4515 (FW-2607)]|nr:hypothetical protein V496_03848 [Pseudogymnoascus sp. VKM F-4515 (FW-2607)]KFY96495.1 hypothetical protein V498_02671 [Pseudogymnoascus sp. VKM F-4517 (FW-2822)]